MGGDGDVRALRGGREIEEGEMKKRDGCKKLRGFTIQNKELPRSPSRRNVTSRLQCVGDDDLNGYAESAREMR